MIFGYTLASNRDCKVGFGVMVAFLLHLLLQVCTSDNMHTSKTQAYG